MVERWVPVVAAVLGVGGGMGGAYIGGNVANQGEQQRLDSARVQQLQDLRRHTYVVYLEELENHFFRGGTPDKARAAEAAVLLVSSPAIRRAAADAVNASNTSDEQRYTRARDEFIRLAQKELAIEP